jgi:hypothetical protein
MPFWKENSGKKRITSIILFIPYAFKRYTITSIFIVLAAAMTIVTLFTGSLTIQLLKKSEKKEPIEYYIILYPPASDKAQKDIWIHEVTALLRQNKFECYSWKYRGMAAIDVLTSLERKSAVRRIKTLLREKGFVNDDVKIESGNNSRRSDTYDIVFESDENKSSLKRTWSAEVENFLRGNGYFASAEYSQFTPAALYVRYPPFREAHSIIEAMRKNGLKTPSAFSLYENTPADEVLLTITGADNSVLLSGFVPLKKYNPEIHRDNSLFAIEIVSPQGNTGVVRVTAHPFAGFRVRFPRDFTPTSSGVSKGIYQVQCSLNDRKLFSVQFEVDNHNKIIWEHNRESQRVFYSRVD